MIFNPKFLTEADGCFAFDGRVEGAADSCLSDKVFCELWSGFTYGISSLALSPSADNRLLIGEASEPELNGYSYAINIEQSGVCIVAADKQSLIHGFMALLDRIQIVDSEQGTRLEIGCANIADTPAVARRMVHFCIFPETELWELEKFVRLCGALRYTHIILEFWGMLRYDCMSELAWSHAFSKDEVRPIIDEARALGLEVIPMFNHWGHASAGRVACGKHVVLDQNPALQTYFNEDGWCWDIKKPKVRALLAQIRAELIELCGEGKYFHIGCDEAYSFDLTRRESMDVICDYINELTAELGKLGRRAIVWGDMFLYRHSHYNQISKYACNCPSPESERYMLDRLSRDAIIADWQYDAVSAPVETSLLFRDAGFDCIVCPWDMSVPKMNSCLSTAKDEGLYGLIHTTWHTLAKGMPYVLMAAVGCYEGREVKSVREFRTSAAALLRKVYRSNGVYERAGWTKYQINDRAWF